MNTTTAVRTGAPAQALARRLEPLHAWWATLKRREQRLTLLALAVVGVFLVWSIAIRPAWTTLRQAPAQLDALDAQLQAMQRMAAEARELRASPSVPLAQSSAALQAASARLGDRAKLVIQADRAVLSVTGIDSESLRSWLAEVRSGARARPLEAQLARGPQGFTGTVTVMIVGAP
jgi:general secretion pathway protein M